MIENPNKSQINFIAVCLRTNIQKLHTKLYVSSSDMLKYKYKQAHNMQRKKGNSIVRKCINFPFTW